jgi:hypothetical protein
MGVDRECSRCVGDRRGEELLAAVPADGGRNPADRTVWWLREDAGAERPLVGGYEHGPAAPRRAYHLNETRRHAFPADTIAVDPEANLRGPWGAGGRFVIRPVSAERRAELDAWDTFCYVHLEDHELKALEELREDSWLGGEWE